mgnify:FL=1
MMDNSIVLEFDKSIPNLAGYEYGVSIYEEQIKGKLDISKNFEIAFPDYIEMIASSFVQGLFSDIVNQIGLANTESRLTIKAATLDIAESIKRKL